MPNFEDILKLREAYAIEAHDSLMAKIKALELSYYESLLEGLDSLDSKDKRLVYSGANFALSGQLIKKLRVYSNRMQKAALALILEATDTLLGYNKEYFAAIEGLNPKKSVREIVLAQIGYDIATESLLDGGWLSNIFSTNDVARKVGGLINSAIAQKMTLPDFRAKFRAAFTGINGAGLFAAHYELATFDLFQMVDRVANKGYADALGLNSAVYSGTAMERTRPFCLSRINKVFDRSQIEGWSKLEWSGKPKIGYNPYLHCGGYNCRHHLSFITDELAAMLKKRQ